MATFVSTEIHLKTVFLTVRPSTHWQWNHSLVHVRESSIPEPAPESTWCPWVLTLFHRKECAIIRLRIEVDFHHLNPATRAEASKYITNIPSPAFTIDSTCYQPAVDEVEMV
ncbi:hypothetical protein ANO14919_014980 [Xylariales sp. No.14919]|nr:hypothetical protein ANO14919_014980 [Xylariales sp. No.14919]